MEKKRLFIIMMIIILFVICIISSVLYYKDKYLVSFETGTDETILTKYISKDEKVSEPNIPIKDGYVFIEWQLNGEKFDFNTKINKDITLSAKWVKEEYIKVTYSDEYGNVIDHTKILKGNSINELPDAEKEGYQFLGWYYKDKLYDGEEINDDIILTAKYTYNKPEYKVGDRVLIVGSYSDSAFSSNAYYESAIGWYRTILYVIDNSNYPYAVGNETGVTGFFDENSLELYK